jgi:hypothetical protein
MISDAPAIAASQFSNVIDATRAYVVTAKLIARDGLTWSEFGELLIGLLRIAVGAANTLSAPGADKKAAVLQSAAALFDGVAGLAMPFWQRPFWSIVRPAVRQLVLAIAAGAIEQLLPMVRAEE